MSNMESVIEFWNSNPLWTGESSYSQGSKEFFEEHYQVYISDCFAGKMDERVFNLASKDSRVLDLGCGIGFWTIEFLKRGFTHLHAVDLVPNSISLTNQRLEVYGFSAITKTDNAEKLSFGSQFFDHVNCQGVIHHSPSIENCIKEIHRVLKPNGTASISVYYKNILIRNWKKLYFIGKWFFNLGAALKGRGREEIFLEKDPKEIVRLYDGKSNPIGNAYTREEIQLLLQPYFEIEEVYYHFFPARSLPFKIPKWLHRLLDKKIPFMIYLNLRKREK